jgi:putative heme transporter
MSESKKTDWKFYVTIATVIIMGVLAYSLRDEIAQVLSDLQRVNVFVLLLLLPIEFFNYDAYARLYRSFFAILSEKVSYKSMFRLTLELNFVNHILPSGGVSGISYFNIRMKSEGVSTAKATLSQVMKLFLLFVSFQPLLVLGLLLLAVRGHVNNLILVVTTAIITLLIVGTLLGIYIIESRSRINSFLMWLTKAVNSVIHFFRRKHPETISLHTAERTFNELHENYEIIKKDWRALKMPFIYTTIANVTEIAAVYVVYAAFGHYVNIGAVILAYAVANFAGLISVLPAGIGIYEALMTAVLAACGIPPEVSIPVTIMYRVLNMIIQLTPGYYYYQKAIKEGLGLPPKATAKV